MLNGQRTLKSDGASSHDDFIAKNRIALVHNALRNTGKRRRLSIAQ
jgi:hypothetical protein